jgi:hypothetical protein
MLCRVSTLVTLKAMWLSTTHLPIWLGRILVVGFGALLGEGVSVGVGASEFDDELLEDELLDEDWTELELSLDVAVAGVVPSSPMMLPIMTTRTTATPVIAHQRRHTGGFGFAVSGAAGPSARVAATPADVGGAGGGEGTITGLSECGASGALGGVLDVAGSADPVPAAGPVLGIAAVSSWPTGTWVAGSRSAGVLSPLGPLRSRLGS